MKIFVDFKSNKMYTGSELLMQNEDIYKTTARKNKKIAKHSTQTTYQRHKNIHIAERMHA